MSTEKANEFFVHARSELSHDFLLKHFMLIVQVMMGHNVSLFDILGD